MYKHRWRWSKAATNSQQNSLFSGMTTNCALKTAGTKAIPEACVGHGPIDQAKRACIAIGQNALSTMLGNNRLPAICNLRDGVIPGDALELAAAFGTHTSQRVEQTIRMIDTL
jgi:hypothetical protein